MAVLPRFRTPGVAIVLAAAAVAAAVPIAPGVDMPDISLGHPDDGSSMKDELLLWLKMGGVGIDTAYVYFNQKDIAAGLQASGVKRSDVFITTKIPCQSTRAATLGMVKEDLNELNVTFVDLMLIHFPCLTKYGNEQTWLGLQDALEMNLTRAIGVSNFDSSQISDLLALGGVPPAVNQCKMSVLHHDDDTISFCKKNNITYESYSPLKSVDLTDKRIASIAKAHNASGAQVALKWIVQQDCTVATSPGLNEEFVKEDLSLDRFQLSDEEMEALSKISS